MKTALPKAAQFTQKHILHPLFVSLPKAVYAHVLAPMGDMARKLCIGCWSRRRAPWGTPRQAC